MSAAPLIRELQAAGIRLQVRGDRLHVEAPAGTVTPELRQRLTDHKADLLELAGLPDATLRAFLQAADDTATRQAGKAPVGDTAAIHCQHCGPVFVHPDIAAVLPVVDGGPRALGCPWCAIRKAGGYVPRPRITCETCQHFKPDPINPSAGMGTCARGHGVHYPMQPHGCADHRC